MCYFLHYTSIVSCSRREHHDGRLAQQASEGPGDPRAFQHAEQGEAVLRLRQDAPLRPRAQTQAHPLPARGLRLQKGQNHSNSLSTVIALFVHIYARNRTSYQ